MKRFRQKALLSKFRIKLSRRKRPAPKKGHFIYHGRAINTVQQFSGLGIQEIYQGLIQTRKTSQQLKKRAFRIVA